MKAAPPPPPPKNGGDDELLCGECESPLSVVRDGKRILIAPCADCADAAFVDGYQAAMDDGRQEE
jgi:hypothetical protein